MSALPIVFTFLQFLVDPKRINAHLGDPAVEQHAACTSARPASAAAAGWLNDTKFAPHGNSGNGAPVFLSEEGDMSTRRWVRSVARDPTVRWVGGSVSVWRKGATHRRRVFRLVKGSNESGASLKNVHLFDETGDRPPPCSTPKLRLYCGG